jgi:hypothetical protein
MPVTTSDDKHPPGEERLTDSPLFWAMLFASVGLVLLAVIGPRYAWRQGLEERKFEARTAERPGDSMIGPAGRPAEDYVAPDRLIHGTGPIFLVLLVVMLIGWAGVVWRLRTRRLRTTTSGDDHQGNGDNGGSGGDS